MPRPKKPKSQCVVPTKPGKMERLRETVMDRSEREEKDILEYVVWQLSKGAERPAAVKHLEKVKSESIFHRQFDVWDVHTTAGRWWVVTNPTNLYPQEEMPSLDYVLSFHIGLMQRVAARHARTNKSPNAARFAAAWRRWEQAAEGVDKACEAEDFQAIGMKCRECLLALVRSAQPHITLPGGADKPKAADFIKWAELMAAWAAPGSSSEYIRGYLRELATPTWQLVNWLTHATHASVHDAEFCVHATNHLLGSLSDAVIRKESARPERCPKCSSYQLQSFYDPDLDVEPPYVNVCLACGWESAQPQAPTPNSPLH